MQEGTYDGSLKLGAARTQPDQASLAAKRERLEQLDIRPAITVYKKPE